MRIPSFGEAARALRLLQGLQKPLNSGISLASTANIPGGTPFTLCPESRSTDLFQISSVVIERQPVYIDDMFTVHIEGEFQDTFSANATFDITGNCGSYCDAYGAPPEERGGETDRESFCELHPIEQPLGGSQKKKRNNSTCPPEKGYAMISPMGWAMPMFLWWPQVYNFTFDAKTEDGRRIYCLTAEVCMRWEDEEKNKRYSTGPWSNLWQDDRQSVLIDRHANKTCDIL
ncbi:hypothetical protein PG989_012264 [Apiospora arundinis]